MRPGFYADDAWQLCIIYPGNVLELYLGPIKHNLFGYMWEEPGYDGFVKYELMSDSPIFQTLTFLGDL